MAAVKELKRDVSYLFKTEEGEIVFTNLNSYQFVVQAKTNNAKNNENKFVYRVTSDLVLLYDSVQKLYKRANLDRTFEGYEGTSGFAFINGQYVVSSDNPTKNIKLSITKVDEDFIIEFSGDGKDIEEGIEVFLDGMKHVTDNSISPYISFSNYLKENYENSLNISIEEYVRTRSKGHNN